MWDRLRNGVLRRRSVLRSGRHYDADTPAIGAGALQGLVENVHVIGHTVDTLLAGLHVDRKRLERPTTRISWRTLVTALDNLERAGTTPAQFEALGAALAPTKHLRVGRFASFFTRAEHIMYVGLRWVGPALFPVIDHDLSTRDPYMIVRLDIPRHLPDSQAYFHICRGTMAAVPTVIGQPPAEVKLTVGPRRAEYQIRCRSKPLGISRVSRTLRAIMSAPQVINALTEQEDELRETFEASVRRQRQLSDLLDALPDGVLVVGTGGSDDNVVYANPAMCRLLGHNSAAKLIGKGSEDLVHPDDTGQAEVRLAHADGRWVHCELSTAPAIDFEDGPGHILVARDITLRKRLQGQLAVADKMRSFGTLAAGIAHEINNPLALILANLELHTSVHGSSPELEAALEGAQRVGAIVGDLRLFSQPDAATPQPVQLADIVESTLSLAAGRISPRATLEVDIQGAPPVLANRGRVGQVLLNLIINAIDAFPGERDARENTIVVRLHRGRDRAVLEVSDNGTGIPPEVRARLFEPFYTTKESGSGLGLAVARGIIEGYGGVLGVETTPGEGTCFRIELPLASGAMASPMPTRPTSESRAARILLIDDEASLLSALRASLELSKHEVVTASSGNAAIQLLARDSAFDAIICDLTMADGGGIHVYEHLRVHAPELGERLVFMTGGTFRRDTRKFLTRVTNPCLEKPFLLEELEAAVHAVSGR